MMLVALLATGCTPTGSTGHPTTSVPGELSGPGQTLVQASAAPAPSGVPGLRSADPFCSAWATYAGTLQALGVAASFGNLSSDQFAALELAAAPRLVETVAEIDDRWPADLAGERAAVDEQRLGPHARRAQGAVDALAAAGVTGSELATMSADWQSALLGRDPQNPVIERPALAAALQAKVDAAARAYGAAVTPFAHDPSLTVGTVDTPLTDAYLTVHCPDLAASGVGDAL